MEQLSTEEYVQQHISRVRKHLNVFVALLEKRAELHDKSKLEEPELSLWKKMDEEPRYRYGTKEYADKLERNKEVFELHYKNNRHHPEHYKNKVNDMTIVDIAEMIADWISYKETLTLEEAVSVCEQQMKRYDFSIEIKNLILNTLARYFTLLNNYEGSEDSYESGVPIGVLEELTEEEKELVEEASSEY